MARYVKTFNLNAPIETVFADVKRFLDSEKFIETFYNNEKVFQKGNGWLTNPTFFKFSYENNTLKFEGWMQYAIAPGVFLGELGTTGFVGCLLKGPFKKRINLIEEIIMKYTA